jgi:hypothetical protein
MNSAVSSFVKDSLLKATTGQNPVKNSFSFPLTIAPEDGQLKNPNHQTDAETCDQTGSTPGSKASIKANFSLHQDIVLHKRKLPLIQYHVQLY